MPLAKEVLKGSGVTDGLFLTNAVRASRKNIRDAVPAARKATGGVRITGFNRGQILCRVAEMMESRRDELLDEVVRAEGRHAPALCSGNTAVALASEPIHCRRSHRPNASPLPMCRPAWSTSSPPRH